MGVLDQRYCNLPCGIACMYRKAPASNSSTSLLIYRDSVFADHGLFLSGWCSYFFSFDVSFFWLLGVGLKLYLFATI